MLEIKEDIETIINLKETKPEELLSVNPVLRTIIDGVCDENCPLSIFRGAPHILQIIWHNVTSYWRLLIKKSISSKTKSHFRSEPREGMAFFQFESDSAINFPKPKQLYINMMPFVMEETFEKCKLPDYLKDYWNELIDKKYICGPNSHKLVNGNEIGKIGYLTIHEIYIDQNNSHRRTGLYTNFHGKCSIAKDKNGDMYMGRFTDNDDKLLNNIPCNVGGGLCKGTYKRWTHPTVDGIARHELLGGIYTASNLSNSSRIWDCRVVQDRNGKEIIGNLGDVEHLREFLPKSIIMKENTMYWITDRTPCESLLLTEKSYIQYFRLVTSQLSLWFEEHSTKNPFGVVPNPTITTVVKGSIF